MKIRKGPDGIHFFDRVSGTNLLLDELIPPPETWSKSPRQVSIALTNRCDLTCPHCYAPKTKATTILTSRGNGRRDGVRRTPPRAVVSLPRGA